MKKLTSMLLASAMFAWTGPVKADPLIELGLAIDVSGSISTANFNLQKQAYINALSNPLILPRDGTVAVGVISFSNTVHPVFTTTVITAATIGSLISSITNNLLDTGGGTAIGNAIAYLSAQIQSNAITSTTQIIDVSTDGDGNSGTPQVAASNAAILAGIDQVNCLGIGSGANCNFVRGTGSFTENAATFADFTASLERKLARETGTLVPEPASFALLGIGLLGLEVVRRRGRA